MMLEEERDTRRASVRTKLLFVAVLVAACGGAGTTPVPATPGPTAATPTLAPTPEPTAAPVEPTVTPTDSTTRAQDNAIQSARDYLDYSAFSRSGLIGQLEYEGYSTADATFAVDSLDVDWDEQAYMSAKAYLEYSSFSLSGLIEQLEYEGFSNAQAKYGAEKAYQE